MQNNNAQAYLGWQICGYIIEQNGGVLDYLSDNKDWFVADKANKGYSVKFSMMMSQAFSKSDINTRIGFDIAESKTPFNINDFNLDNYTPSENRLSDSSDEREEKIKRKKMKKEHMMNQES